MELAEKIALYIFYAFEIWIMSYFVIVTLFVLLDLLNVRFAKRISYQNPQLKNYSFAVLVPLHQNIDFLEPILDSLLKQSYNNISFFVIADDCPAINLPYADERIQIFHPPVALHSKIKSIQLALQHIPEDKFDALAILDADNLVHPDFFKVMNAYYNKGFKAVQSTLAPKNIDTTFARLDTINDQYYNFIDRRVPSKLGLNANISGRGTVVDIKMYKSVSYNSLFGGFDKKLQCELAKQTTIGYASDAILYDEKVSDGNSMQKQRTRWINAYFRYFKEAGKVFFAGLFKGNFRVMFAGYTNMRPPLFIQLFLALVILLINVLFFPKMVPYVAIILGAYLLSFLYIVIFKNKLLSAKESINTVFKIPLFISRQVKALFNIKKANRSFLQTDNYKAVFIDDILHKN
ncbi:glycosyltransferase family 2 protein [Danxiaibacter flavus]|uniref:Glycosyltransferase family 2 protein n=1 Tax=Danxiaibacter flavus TaxID=3049108 RepID=A0ABV3ZG80_9BACT|nr:glycosyltransferase family 2 protein [Chitinophagaceae bacterium DXS]